MTAIRNRAPVFPMIERISEVAVLPHVVFSILEPVGSEEPDAETLYRYVSVDPGLAAKIITLANELSDERKPVRSLRQAVQLLGYGYIRTLAMTAGTFEMFVGKSDQNSLRRRRWWKQSVDTSICCRWLAKKSGKAEQEEAATLGLIHLLGKMLLDRYGQADYTLVTERQASGEKDSEAETTVYGCTHVELLMALARRWGYPLDLVDALDYQDHSLRGGDSAHRSCLAVGSRLAMAASRGPGMGSGYLAECPDWALEQLGMDREQLRFVLEEGVGILTK